jgi:hypothetical protein
MSTYKDEEDINLDEAREEALTEPEAPGQVLDPLAEPVGTRGTRREVMSEYDEEDARERPPEDGLNPDVPEDESLRVLVIQDFKDELEDVTPSRGNSDEIVEGETRDVTVDPAEPASE